MDNSGISQWSIVVVYLDRGTGALMPFAGQNHLFAFQHVFQSFFHHKPKKRKIMKNIHVKRGSTSIKVLFLKAG